LLEVDTLGQRGKNARERVGVWGWIKVEVEFREAFREAPYFGYCSDAIGSHQAQMDDGRKEGYEWEVHWSSRFVSDVQAEGLQGRGAFLNFHIPDLAQTVYEVFYAGRVLDIKVYGREGSLPEEFCE
jgi:hypothetical protein